MLEGFTQETAPLNCYESETVLPELVKLLRTKYGKYNAVTNGYIIASLKSTITTSRNKKIGEARVRKLINHIRTNDLIPGLMATSEGYFIASSAAELAEYEESLKSREDAIRAARLSIARQRREFYEGKQQDPQLF